MTATAALTLTCVTSCIEETTPNDEATNESISTSSESLEYLTNALPSFLTTWCTYGRLITPRTGVILVRCICVSCS